MHPVAVHWAKKSNCSAEEWYSASFRLSAYNDSCTALTHNWESLLLNTYKQHIAHFMMWEQKNNELCCGWSKNTLAYVEIISQLLLHDKGSLQCAKSPITYGFKVFVFLLAKRSHNNPNLGLAKIWHQILRPLSGQFIWTRKKRPSSDVLGTRPRGLDPTGQNSPTDSQTPISVVSEGRHEGEYRDTTPLLQYLWTINDSAKMSSEISCRWLAKRGN